MVIGVPVVFPLLTLFCNSVMLVTRVLLLSAWPISLGELKLGNSTSIGRVEHWEGWSIREVVRSFGKEE